MRKLRIALGALVASWLALGCCSRGRFPSDVQIGAHVRRDELVEGWRVNGKDVCAKEIVAANACYVLDVQYGASFMKYNGPKARFSGLISPLAGAVEYASQIHRADYHSGLVPFVLRADSRVSYYVTATFTGDEFIPRIIVLDGAGSRLGQIDPAQSEAELQACEAGKPAPSPPAKVSSFTSTGSRSAWLGSRYAQRTSRVCGIDD